MVEAFEFTLDLDVKEANFRIGQGETQYRQIWAWAFRGYMVMFVLLNCAKYWVLE